MEGFRNFLFSKAKFLKETMFFIIIFIYMK